MSKWADKLISAVRYNAARTHITRVEVRSDLGESVGDPSVVTRADVIADMADNRTSYKTIYKKSDKKKWREGAAVKVVAIDGEDYLKTTADSKKVDNLGDLPTF